MYIISCSDVYNLMEEIIINAYSSKIDILIIKINNHNFAYDQYFFFETFTILFYIILQSYLSILKAQFSRKIPNGPFSHSRLL